MTSLAFQPSELDTLRNWEGADSGMFFLHLVVYGKEKKTMLTRMYLYSTSTKLSIDVWLYLDRPGSLTSLAYWCTLARVRSLAYTPGGGGAPPLWKVIGTCRWTGYDFAGHQYWHRVSNRPNVVITIGTGYQIGLMWSSPLTQGIKIGLLGYGRLLRLSQDRMPIVFYDRPAIQAEAMTFFFFFFFDLVSSASPIRQGISEEYNIATGYAFECF